MWKRFLKTGARSLAGCLTFPLALLGRGGSRSRFQLAAQLLSLIPGGIGNYLRMAYYRQTLAGCGAEGCVSFLSFFSHPGAVLGEGVYIGSFTVIGRARIGARCQIADRVQILSGARQHGRAADGRILGAEQGQFEEIRIGQDVWIGAGAIIMADVGDGATIGAGAVVTRPIAPNSIAVGVPARER